MKTTFAILPALAALCQAAALLQDADIRERDQLAVRQVTIIVTQTTTRTSTPPVYTTSTKYTTLPTQVVTKTSTITKPYSPPEITSTVVVTVTAKPTTVSPPPVTVTVTAKTSTSAKPIVTVTVTYTPPGETQEPEYTDEPEWPEETPVNSWQITRTVPVLTFGKRAPSPAPQRGQGRPTRGGGWGPGGQQTIVQTETVKETVTLYPPTGITRTVTITPDVPDSPSTSTIYYTPPPVSTREPVYVTSTVTITPTITAGATSITKTITPSPTAKSTIRSTVTIWDGAVPKGKRSPQTFGIPSRTNAILPTETEYPEEGEPEWTDEPDYPDDEPTYVLGTPTRTVNVSPTPVKPITTSTKKASTSTKKTTSTKKPSTTSKPWWYQDPVTVTITKYQPQPTGTLIRNTATLPVLTLRDDGGAQRLRQERR